MGPELHCLLKVKGELTFQHAILNAKQIIWIDVVIVVKDIIVIFRKKETTCVF